MKYKHISILTKTALFFPFLVSASVPSDVDARWKQATIKTHPDQSYYPNSNLVDRKNVFDWRTQYFQVGMSSLQGDDELKPSPFYMCEVDSFYNIPGGTILTENIMGPNGKPPETSCAISLARSILDKVPDMNPDEGWELVKFNLGYNMSHYKNAKSEWSADGDDAWTTNQYPYIILYNRLTAKLRVLGYFSNYAIGTGISVKMSVLGKAKLFNTNQAADAKFYNPSVSGYGSINNSIDGGWGVADFNMELDPCAPGQDIDLDIVIKPKSVASIELYGHSVGISENVTESSLGDPKKYLMEVSGSLQDNLDQAGNYTITKSSDLAEMFANINNSATSNAVTSDALGAAGAFLGGLMEIGPLENIKAGISAVSGIFGGVGSIFGTKAAAVPDYAAIVPQISFSEIYLRGESTSEDPGIRIKLKLPGSKSTVWNNELNSNASANRSYPLYDEPMGLFTLLTTPKVHIDKDYSEYSSSDGYKVTTLFKPANVALVLNEKSGLKMSGWRNVPEDGLAIEGRLKIKYLVEDDVTPQFINLYDSNGSGATGTDVSYVNMTTDGKATKLYTVLTEPAPLMYLAAEFGTNYMKYPKIITKGGTAVVDDVSLVVSMRNVTSKIHDTILNRDIQLIDKKDSSGEQYPYYLTIKEYPTIFNGDGNNWFYNLNSDLIRLYDENQIGGALSLGNTGTQLSLGNSNSKSIAGYCSAQGAYNERFENTRYDKFTIIADEDMNYYAYEPKQVSEPKGKVLYMHRDSCSSCSHSKTWPFLSFNLREYVSRYGFRQPKKVSLGLSSNVDTQVYKYNAYLFSANKSTSAMKDTPWNADTPYHSSYIGVADMDNYYETTWLDVTEAFKEALERVQNSNGDYEQPRLSFVIDPDGGKTDGNLSSSEEQNKGPALAIEF